jgi:two-component system sensor histidine kinase CiaH
VNLFKKPVMRLALSYLAIIMLMSIGFSAIFYTASAHELGRQLPPPSLYEQHDADGGGRGPRPEVKEFFQTRIAEGRRTLLIRLVLINISALGVGSYVSYYLARRTLRPIEANMEAQAQFVSDASHELRTPLTAMQVTNEVALRRHSLPATDARIIITQNLEDVRKLQDLTNALLRLSVQNSDALRPASVSLQDVASEAINRVAASAQVKHISIEETVPPIKVMADKASLVQAVVVLLDNAIKYSSAGSSVKVDGAHKGKHVVFRVSDEGPGVNADDIPHIFDRFYRADKSRNQMQTEGYGIGLALAKKIIDQHGGEISVVSTEGKGATFSIKLPLA